MTHSEMSLQYYTWTSGDSSAEGLDEYVRDFSPRDASTLDLDVSRGRNRAAAAKRREQRKKASDRARQVGIVKSLRESVQTVNVLFLMLCQNAIAVACVFAYIASAASIGWLSTQRDQYWLTFNEFVMLELTFLWVALASLRPTTRYVLNRRQGAKQLHVPFEVTVVTPFAGSLRGKTSSQKMFLVFAPTVLVFVIGLIEPISAILVGTMAFMLWGSDIVVYPKVVETPTGRFWVYRFETYALISGILTLGIAAWLGSTSASELDRRRAQALLVFVALAGIVLAASVLSNWRAEKSVYLTFHSTYRTLTRLVRLLGSCMTLGGIFGYIWGAVRGYVDSGEWSVSLSNSISDTAVSGLTGLGLGLLIFLATVVRD